MRFRTTTLTGLVILASTSVALAQQAETSQWQSARLSTQTEITGAALAPGGAVIPGVGFVSTAALVAAGYTIIVVGGLVRIVSTDSGGGGGGGLVIDGGGGGDDGGPGDGEEGGVAPPGTTVTGTVGTR